LGQKYFIDSFSYPLFLSGGSRAAAAGGLEIPHGQQQSLVVLLALHEHGTKQRRRCSDSMVFGRTLDCLPVDMASRTCLEHSGDMAEPA